MQQTEALEEGFFFVQEEKQEDEKEESFNVRWEESESSDSEDEQSEIANFRMVDKNIWFMGNEAEVISESEDIITSEELKDAFEEVEKVQKLRKIYSSLKKAHACCNNKINELVKKKRWSHCYNWV